jgi:CRP-like cAMP-binding protein
LLAEDSKKNRRGQKGAMKVVHQKGHDECGLACVAMFAKVRIATAAKEFVGSKAGGTSVDQIRSALKAFGFRMGPLKGLRGRPLRSLKNSAILAGWSDDDAHWAVWTPAASACSILIPSQNHFAARSLRSSFATANEAALQIFGQCQVAGGRGRRPVFRMDHVGHVIGRRRQRVRYRPPTASVRMSHQKNFILNRLGAEVLARLSPSLSVVDLQLGDVLAETHGHVERVYFPHGGIISSVVELVGGGAIEAGMIGRDGVFGAAEAFDGKVSLNHVVVQVPGEASVIPADQFRMVADQFPDMRKLFAEFNLLFLAQVQQTAACNATHSVEARTCKWLLRMHGLAGPDLPLTQEFLAQMMGVRRTSVSLIAADLKKMGMIDYRRGHVRILDLEQIRRRACECQEALEEHYECIFGSDVAAGN